MGRAFHDTDSRRYIDWIKYAKTDYSAAVLLAKDPQCFMPASFHCQQCIEKALKAYLLYKKHRHYDGHNLTWLCRQAVIIDAEFEKFLFKSTVLNRYYIETRYPADIQLEVTSENIKELLHDTKEMLEFISARVK
jgi:HEPN domain-containing protein